MLMVIYLILYMYMYLKKFFHEREFYFFERDFFVFAERGTSVKSHATHAVGRGMSVEVAWILRGNCVGFAWVLRGTLSFFCLNVNAKDINVSLPVLYLPKAKYLRTCTAKLTNYKDHVLKLFQTL